MQGTLDEVYRSAAVKVAAGDYATAVTDLTESLRVDPDAGRLWELRGQAHLALGETVEAVSCLEHATCLVPLSIEARMALGRSYELTGRKELACQVFLTLVKVERIPFGVLEPLARALGRLGQLRAALRLCFDASERDPESPAPLLGIAFYQRRLGYPPEKLLCSLLQAFHLQPDDFDIRLTLARTLHQCRRSEEAASLLSVVDIETSMCPSCLAAMQRIFEAAGDEERARRCMNSLVSIVQS
ncbi:MAG: tetratricopeptide repeat protein [Planctomycetota bacterium]